MAGIRVLDEPGFVLHSIPYKETSLILDVFTRSHGRLALIAKGAKRPHSSLRPVLQRFQPLLISWSGKSELRTLTKSEWVGGSPALVGDALLCGFYLNELLVKFLAREDAYEVLYDQYAQTIYALSQIIDSGADIEQTLRPFELALLRETGYAAALDHCVETQESHRHQPGADQFHRQAAKGQGDIIFGDALAQVAEQAQHQPEAEAGAQAQCDHMEQAFTVESAHQHHPQHTRIAEQQ